MQILAGVNSQATTTYHVFTSSGTLTVTANGTVEVLTIGGGGGGGYNGGGGGGGAEVDYWTSCALTGNVTVTVGALGNKATTDVQGSNGGDTIFTGFVTSLGGGGAGSGNAPNGVTGGSGGGGSFNNGTGGGASGNNTNIGGNGLNSGSTYSAGGGGGATAAGITGTSVSAGNGGQGLTLTTIDTKLTSANFPTTLTGMTTVASGGGGAVGESVGATAGTAGTGAGNGSTTTVGANATMYGCGGGGGCFNLGVSYAGGDGFSGLVIIRYATGTVTASGGQETVAVAV